MPPEVKQKLGGFRVEGFRIWGLGFRIWGLGFRGLGLSKNGKCYGKESQNWKETVDV